MSDPLWHQAVRNANYEPLNDSEAEAVAEEATAILSRPTAAGSAPLQDRRSQLNSINYEAGIRGWDTQPPTALPEIGGISIYQIQPILHRAIASGSRYLRGPKISSTPTTTDEEPSEALQRIRERLERRRKDHDK